MATFAVTGATGFIGRALVNTLVARGHDVRALSRRAASDLETLAQPIPGTLEDTPSLVQLVSGVDGVIHLAGATAAIDRATYFKTNAAGTTRLLEAIEANTESIPLVYVSSLAAREPDLSDYASSKRAGETLVESAKMPWTILRPPAVYGPGDPGLSPLWALLKHGWLPQIGPPEGRFSLIDVDELAEATARLAEHMLNPDRTDRSFRGEILEVDDQFTGELGPGYGWADIASIAEDVFSKRPRVIPIPPLMLKAMAFGSERVGRLRQRPAIFNVGKASELSHPDWVAKKTPNWAQLGWTPSRQLRDTLAYL